MLAIAAGAAFVGLFALWVIVPRFILRRHNNETTPMAMAPQEISLRRLLISRLILLTNLGPGGYPGSIFIARPCGAVRRLHRRYIAAKPQQQIPAILPAIQQPT